MKRRKFLQLASQGTLVLGLSPRYIAEAFAKRDFVRLTILHTNDLHSRIDPFPMDGSRNEGRGGASRRAKMIKEIRAQEENVLLFDSGDILQGTPYFNLFDGKVEFQLMDQMQYDASTIGNHDFDGGIELLAARLRETQMDMLNCNYDLSDTILATETKDHKIFEIEGIKIGVTGVGIELDGLVPKKLYGETRYMDPISSLNQKAKELKNDYDCDYVICLSHLGLQYRDETVCDLDLASQSEDVDVILGGHTHTFMTDPDVVMNKVDKPVIINQVGWAGILLGRIDLAFEKGRSAKCMKCNNLWVDQWKTNDKG